MDPVLRSQLISQGVSAAIGLAGTVLMILLTWVGVKAKDYIDTHTQNAAVRGALERVENAVITAAKATQQTYVDALRTDAANGQLTAEQEWEARGKAIATAESMLGADLGDIQGVLGLSGSKWVTFLEGKVEAFVHDRNFHLATNGIGAVAAAAVSSIPVPAEVKKLVAPAVAEVVAGASGGGVAPGK